MSIYSLCFSPTGGTKKVVELVAGQFEVDAEIDLVLDRGDEIRRFEEQDLCFLAVPSFGGRVPAVAIDRLRKMEGNGAKAIIVVAYGNREYDDTLLELKNTANECGFQVVGAVAAVAEHSIMRQYGKGRPDRKDAKELQDFSLQLKEAMKIGEPLIEVNVPGNESYRVYNGVPLKPKVAKGCRHCGKCGKYCPVDAISKDNPTKTDKEKCISCMACVAICPAKARTVNKVKLFVASRSLNKACAERKKNQLFLGEKK